MVGATPGATHLPGLPGPLAGALVSTAVFDGREGLVDSPRRLVRVPAPRGLAAVASTNSRPSPKRGYSRIL